MNYTTTSFPDELFSKSYTIESICHAEKKLDVIREMHRILSKKGVLVLAEYFKMKNRMTREDNINYNEWLDGWAMPYLASVKEMVKDLKKYHFKKIEVHDMTEFVKNSSGMMFDYAQNKIASLLLAKKFDSLNETAKKHLIATARQKYCIDNGLWGYFFIKAVKG